MTEMPLRDVPGRLAVLANAVNVANEELARASGMAMGTGYEELSGALEDVGPAYVLVEQALSSWRLELRHGREDADAS